MMGHRHCRPKSGRHHRILSVLPLSFLALSGDSLSLLPPGRQCFSFHKSSVLQSYELRSQYKRRRRRIFELQLQLSSGQDGAYPKSTILPSSGNRAIDRRFTGFSSRVTTSLLMTQNSDSTREGGFGKDDETKKKRETGNDAGGSPKPKANKRINKDESMGQSSGIVKGSSAPNDKNSENNANDGAKRTRLKGEKGKNRKQQNNKGQSKEKVNEASVLDTGKSIIQSSDENTSLKGFKSERKPNPPPRQNQGVSGSSKKNENEIEIGKDDDLKKRVVQLETIVSNQLTEIQKLRREVDDLTRAGKVFSKVLDVLRKAGLQIEEEDEAVVVDDDDADEDVVRTKPTQPFKQQTFHDMEIFGIAPKSVTDAADTAGASMLSAILAGKHRMLVDVRDAELTRDPKLLVEFIELAILPVAAGLEGLDYVKNRVKIVFPTVKELMSYRKSMALAAPEVVSLSTLGFEPVEERDNLIVVIAPSPDDAAGVAAMEKLIARTDKNYVEPERRILQPVVVMNHHMVPVDMTGFGKFTTVYHLRLLSVQYMTGDSAPEFVTNNKPMIDTNDVDGSIYDAESAEPDSAGSEAESNRSSKAVTDKSEEEDEALEAAMTHAHEIGFHQGVTRAMVIRAYPKPWHVFVDTSPDTDADFEVAATFDTEPTQEDVNYAIVECLEGSEREDEIVAQQMQAALEAGQLNRVSEILGISPSDMVSELRSNTDDYKPFQDYDGKDWDDLYYDDWFSEDSV
ncbi:hypothetical protein ACHAXA_011850 [Cyclostephanos tholiformis]|uniref:DUF1995 domain-containing protein n=1 Tax=Cyclostephanos tholiformis TaxID=382380 RepID=A0ABD3RWK4_9STRA